MALKGMSTAPLAPEGYSSSINTPDIKPYILLLGSFRSLDLTQRAVSHFQKMNIAVHWNRANPGSSSEWYRLYTGRFKTMEEAQQYKNKNRFHDAIVPDRLDGELSQIARNILGFLGLSDPDLPLLAGLGVAADVARLAGQRLLAGQPHRPQRRGATPGTTLAACRRIGWSPA